MEKSVYCKWVQPTATLVHAAFYTHVFLEQQTVLALERVFCSKFYSNSSTVSLQRKIFLPPATKMLSGQSTEFLMQLSFGQLLPMQDFPTLKREIKEKNGKTHGKKIK